MTPLYGGHFASAEDRRRAVERAARPLAPEVAAALEGQDARLPPDPARRESLATLRRGAAAVVTGQQVGLFLGPLYTIYKAASAVRLAAELTRETGTPVVPVFWLQTEDHDLVEVAHCHVPRSHGVPLVLDLPVSADNRVSIAHCTLSSEVDACVAELRASLGHLPDAALHLSRIDRHYRAGVPWGDAFAGVLAELFEGTGLVLLQPRDPAFNPVASRVHRRAIEEAEPISRALLERVRLLESHGFEEPIHVRAGAPLSFFHPEGVEGPRYRLAPLAGGFVELGREKGAHTTETLLEALEKDARHFSTSALLRPILQDSLLPTAAYVGGPAEVAYFAQLAPLYAAFGMTMPLIAPRARFRVLDDRAMRLLEKTGLSPDDASKSEDTLLAQLGEAESPALAPEGLQSALKDAFERGLATTMAQVPHASLGMDRALGKAQAKVSRAIDTLRQSYASALLHRDAGKVDEVRRLRALLFPEEGPQERTYGVSYFASRYGDAAFLRCVLEAVSPFDPRLKDLRP